MNKEIQIIISTCTNTIPVMYFINIVDTGKPYNCKQTMWYFLHMNLGHLIEFRFCYR